MILHVHFSQLLLYIWLHLVSCNLVSLASERRTFSYNQQTLHLRYYSTITASVVNWRTQPGITLLYQLFFIFAARNKRLAAYNCV